MSEVKSTNNDLKKPLSRFWACFFSFTIFSFLWICKVEKTGKWIAVDFIRFSIFYIGLLILVILPESPDTFTGSEYLIIPSLILFVIFIVMPMHFMYKWTTEYNLNNFGYKSKGEWEKANMLQQNITQKIKEYPGDTSPNINDMDTNTSEKIPTEKIKDPSMKTTEKITDIPKNLKPKVTMSKDDKRKQIREWHDMLTQGIITESDFEKKISDLSKSE